MKRILYVVLSFAALVSCGSDEGIFGGGGQFEERLVAGELDQSGVTYNDGIGTLSFSQTSQVGDSTFFEASLDFDANSSVDLLFTLVRWDDIQVLTMKGRNGIEIPFSGNEFEILETQDIIPGINLIQEGTEINSLIKNYASGEDGFLTYTRGNSVSTSANIGLWSNVVYLPWNSPSSSKEGWVGFTIASNSGVQVDGIEIDVVAIK